MRKFNKIFMMTVAILLTLVLISSCILSGTMARFAISKNATATATLEKFGVRIDITSPQETLLKASGATVTLNTNTKKKEATSTITGLKMAPGDLFYKAVNFAFSGTPVVPVIVKIQIDITFGSDSTNDYDVPKGTGGLTAKTWVVPMGFTFSSGKTAIDDATYALAPWQKNATRANIDANDIENLIATGIKDKFASGKATSSSNVVTTSQLPAGQAVALPIGSGTVNNFDMGFAWPYAHSDGTLDYDEIATYLADHDTSAVNVTYTVSIEQAA